jgi:hypothetical protein
MEHWARGPLGRRVDFLCICVDTLQTAQTFHRLFEFRGCVNGWVPSPPSMPSFGQLGCSGFVVLDGKGGCASRKTLPFLQHGEAAFAALEALLARLVPAAPPAPAAAAAAAAAPAAAEAAAPGKRRRGAAAAPASTALVAAAAAPPAATRSTRARKGAASAAE